MNCKEIYKILPFYLDGCLEEIKRERVREHLELCAGCAEKLRLLRLSVELIENYPLAEPPLEFTAKVMARLGPARQLGVAKRNWQQVFPLVAAGLAAGIFVFFIASDLIKVPYLESLRLANLLTDSFRGIYLQLLSTLSSYEEMVLSLPSLLSSNLPTMSLKIMGYIGLPATLLVNLLLYFHALRGKPSKAKIPNERRN